MNTHRSVAPTNVPIVIGSLLLTVLALPCAGQDYNAWTDDPANPVLNPGSRASYPSVILDPAGFGTPAGPPFKAWYDNGAGSVLVSTSSDGVAWSLPAVATTGLVSPAHPQVLYDAGAFGVSGGPCYRIWYWDTTGSVLYSIAAIRSAESTDGINWVNDQALTQDATQPLISNAPSAWNRGSYGPACLFY
jgi:hypothetical protein